MYNNTSPLLFAGENAPHVFGANLFSLFELAPGTLHSQESIAQRVGNLEPFKLPRVRMLGLEGAENEYYSLAFR